MRKKSYLHDQRGVALVVAIFLLVVLAALGVYMVTMSGVQSRTPVLGLQGARAYQAARSGAEWGIYGAENGSCNANTPFTVGNFKVTVNCTQEPSSGKYHEGNLAYHVFKISALAEYGTYGSMDYVSRQVEVRVTGP